MNSAINFTKATLAALPLPRAGKRAYYRDAKTRGLHFAITDRGTRSYVFYRKIGGRPERLLIGRFEDLSIEQARNRAAELNALIARGENPADHRRVERKELTLGELWEIYLHRHAKPNKKFWKQDESKFNQYITRSDRGGIKLAHRKMSAVRRSDLAHLHATITCKHATTANRVLALVSSMYSWSKRAGLWEGANPAEGIQKNRERARDRFLQAGELPRFFAALGAESNETLRDFVWIALLTGARESNVLAMRWADTDLQAGTWYIPETKNGTPQLVPLTEHAVAILRAREERAPREAVFVFEGSGRSGHLTVPKRGWYRILRRAGIPNFRIHDLRRTLGSWQATTGASLPIIGKTLNHKHPSSTAIYARLETDPVRAAMEKAQSAMLLLAEPPQVDGAVKSCATA